MRKLLSGLLVMSVIATSACTTPTGETDFGTETSAEQSVAIYDLATYASMTPEEICQTLTLDQKAAQMIQPTINNTLPSDMDDTDKRPAVWRLKVEENKGATCTFLYDREGV